ncbi:MAG: amine dehydrogenase large subunit [Gammaproteobacteria bacterium]
MKRAILVLTSALICAGVSAVATAELAPEKLTVAVLRAPTPHRLYLTDLALGHVIDGRVHVIDGMSSEYLGIISTGMFGVTALSRDSSEMYVATTYYTKRNRGKRFDQFEAYSTADLSLTTEIEIPAKHAQALPYKGTITSSSDSRFVYIQNSTPASSVAVVDRKASKYVGEIATPGCWIILPAGSHAARFSTLCGDGTLVTVTLDENGEPLDQQRSAKLFDAEKDPLFVQGEPDGDTYYFVSYEGNVHEINVGGEVAKSEKVWSMVSAEDRSLGWKPGGYQVIALDRKNRRLYVGMHDSAKDGSHKWPAKEIWAFDIDARERVDRAPGGNAIAMVLTKEDQPSLYAYDGMTTTFHRYETLPMLKQTGETSPYGEFAGLVEAH